MNKGYGFGICGMTLRITVFSESSMISRWVIGKRAPQVTGIDKMHEIEKHLRSVRRIFLVALLYLLSTLFAGITCWVSIELGRSGKYYWQIEAYDGVRSLPEPAQIISDWHPPTESDYVMLAKCGSPRF